MFDYDISLFILSMWITIICYSDCSHAMLTLWITIISYFDCSPDSGRWWINRIRSGNTEGIRG